MMIKCLFILVGVISYLVAGLPFACMALDAVLDRGKSVPADEYTDLIMLAAVLLWPIEIAVALIGLCLIPLFVVFRAILRFYKDHKR